ncbi:MULTISPECIES: hypothetical protein [unclassified Bradyrhizobium]|uniref:hypothetical protein n=1 Tax=unclassified Bradyrhizobium TaxID=2631580 RepID=UPI00201BE508|nr:MULTISPECIES: hypothetical protein [unclassified Bradyrhizobium]
MTTTFLSPLVLPGVIIGFGLLMLLSRFDLLPVFKNDAGWPSGLSETLREARIIPWCERASSVLHSHFAARQERHCRWCNFCLCDIDGDVAISLFLSDFNTYTLPVALTSLIRSSFDLTIATAAVALMGLTLVLLIVLDRVLGLERTIGYGTYRSR